MNVRSLSMSALLAGIILVSPLFANAVGKQADQMCNPVVMDQCPCGQQLLGSPPQCQPSGNKHLCVCTDTTSGGVTTGICTMAMHCEGKTAGGKGVDSGLQQLGQMLGQLLQKLGQGGGSGGGAGAPPATMPPLTSSGCTTSYFQTSDFTQLTNPCAQYVAPPVPIGTATCDTLSQELGTCSGSTSTEGALTASPDSGAAPLTVTFTANVPDTTYTLDFGDDSDTQNGSCSDGCVSIPVNTTHRYDTAGTYTATLTNGSGVALGTATILVSSANGGGTQGGGTTLSSLFSATNTLNLSGLGSVTSLTPGSGGNGGITFSLNGTTIFGTGQDIPSNTGVAGFFGADTFGGGQPQGLAAHLCETRPWSSGFLSNILTTNFFDGLCTLRGYQVGAPPAPAAPVVQLQQTKPAPKPVIATTTPFTSTVPPKVRIWAAPPSVPLDSRTSIFWTSQGVTGCTETSPDGSFNQTSLSGGAATVPITDATTYSISCVDQDGNPVTASVTVQISI